MKHHHLLFQMFGPGSSRSVLRWVVSGSSFIGTRESDVPFRFALKALAPHLFRTCFFSSLFIRAYTSSGTSHFHFSLPEGIDMPSIGLVFFFGEPLFFFMFPFLPPCAVPWLWP